MAVIVYTDGGCSGNPGPGGWAFVADTGDETVKRSGGKVQTTNNRMELQAVIEALTYLTGADTQTGRPIVIHTDSQYVQKGITQWIKNWIRNGWKTASKKPVKNKDLWQQLHNLTNKCDVTWEWVKGHDGIEGNEECDAMVQVEIGKHR